ncbi:hypothetical protein ACFE04_024308 [Oxalis oulophora]
MKMKKGFMCQSSEIVCMANDPRSVIVPRRPDKTIFDDSRLMNSSNYSRLIESRRFVPSTTSKKRASVYVPASNININVRKASSTTTSGTDHNKQLMMIKQEEPNNINLLQNPSSTQVFQVVVMRVSLHCQGCAGKVKKHLSKMEGVTSFSIDLETQRVTVMGHVSPNGVLESISKVKRAEFWNC